MKALLGRLPAYPGSCLFAAGLNLAIAPRLPTDVCAALNGKTVSIRVTDAGVRFDVRWQKGRFEAQRPAGAPDLAIGASARDFLLLAQRREDPDTLFFGRRLSMEGDTELGLLLKNTLDALELPLFDPARWRR
jgi:predicted lipid carrier protein YhbT